MERVKAASLLHTGLDRYEVFDFQGDRLGELNTFLKTKRRPFSFHVPFFRPSYFPHTGVSTFFLNDAKKMRELSFRIMNSTLYFAKGWEADFTVTHLVWKDDSKNRRKVMNFVSDTKARFSEISDSYNIPINVEFGGYSGYFHEPVQFVEFVSDNPMLGICLDIGHTFLISKTRNRNFFKDIESLAPQTKSIHVWNTKGLDHCKKHNHVPVHPSQKTGDGWIDIKKTLEIILDCNKECDIVFEYNHTYFDKIPQKVQEGMDWVRSIAER
ncbi:MAG: hypothetical protein D8M57_14210 [Candidatus Scalindua sp. AMX11]|nr:MAG: hypothetical protein DWQ00_09485 [Candidatus Scalindua sp.]NOG83556.1 hypothetical protein [Planctomycetota bacterium]RZV70940.1 MAG: hypothetical protein EX341_15160 [Candidatus Scalindua sp. SCAELEC01]TDE64247.1 MAG: hypothetical protein D8M57_14210 [Candidatus Scalindua sp. AMX11]GJQ59960.1 MAG: hypothetical protein SCALA701_27610 [Candidatus Scalindua sp.]